MLNFYLFSIFVVLKLCWDHPCVIQHVVSHWQSVCNPHLYVVTAFYQSQVE